MSFLISIATTVAKTIVEKIVGFFFSEKKTLQNEKALEDALEIKNYEAKQMSKPDRSKSDIINSLRKGASD
jgi:hypothetical protein